MAVNQGKANVLAATRLREGVLDALFRFLMLRSQTLFSLQLCGGLFIKIIIN